MAAVATPVVVGAVLALVMAWAAVATGAPLGKAVGWQGRFKRSGRWR